MTAVFTFVLVLMREGVKLVMGLVDNLEGLAVHLTVLGITGMIGMAIAVGLGVWVSVRISIGEQAAKRNPSFTWWVVNRLAFLVGVMNLSTFIVFFMQLRLGYEGTSAAGPGAVLMLVVAGFIMISSIASGFLADKFGRKTLIIVSAVMATVGTLIAISVPNLYMIYAGGAVVGLATGLFFTANWALGTEIVPKDEAGKYLGISNLAGAGAGAVGAYIGGPIADHFTKLFPEMNGIGYVLVFGIYAAMFLLSILPLLLVKEPKNVEEPIPVVG
jgi:MFS family permease